MHDFQKLLRFLTQSPIDFVLVGGMAAVLHGCNQTTRGIDICIHLSLEQIESLRLVLAPLHPRHRLIAGAPSFIDFPKDCLSLESLHLETDYGILDIIFSVKGVGSYYDVLSKAQEIEIYGEKCYLISLDHLIQSKKALGRHRDLILLEELEAIREQKEKPSC